MTDIELNLTGLDKLIKAVKARLPEIKVGILGQQERVEGDLSNADIGAFHEFGTSQLPQRSFLRVPLMDNLSKELKKSGVLDKFIINECIKTASLVPLAKRVAIVAEGVVLGAFDTNGYGKWPPSQMNHKTNHQTLVETGQVRDSITSEVKE